MPLGKPRGTGVGGATDPSNQMLRRCQVAHGEEQDVGAEAAVEQGKAQRTVRNRRAELGNDAQPHRIAPRAAAHDDVVIERGELIVGQANLDVVVAVVSIHAQLDRTQAARRECIRRPDAGEGNVNRVQAISAVQIHVQHAFETCRPRTGKREDDAGAGSGHCLLRR